ncbi:response regulator transcription factor [Streptomyces sp. NBC_00439]|uniref:response regulator transcription factor n=1 Tax=unclassified Streptomyces TaxID=2593676 RepID=UPI002253C827|nr:helix-turn-helix transcriptional regulator [Streptomyces sp. NBC_00439]MCX5103620.1 helix-turn-helix transcriptional regulator [Streptomyces sp. NBC_00439]WSX06230.1 helix-turn-helix transcriptional regulator [Streptomyces sp. NBC_00987]
MTTNEIGGNSQMSGVVVQARDVHGGIHHHAAPQMSPTEIEIVRLISQSATNKAIACATGLSPNSVKGALHSLMTRLGTRSRGHTVAYAARHDLI